MFSQQGPLAKAIPGREHRSRAYVQLDESDIEHVAISVSSVAGLCFLYPRCLLYACCSPELLEDSTSASKEPASDFFYTDINIPLNMRMLGHPLTNITITKGILAHGLASLKPSPQHAYEALRSRPDFRVLYLAQGDYHRRNLQPWYLNMKDLLYLSFEEVEADFFFPESNLCEGRMALYLAARLLESYQGWLYDYFIFLDDDVSIVSSSTGSSLFFFELDLLQWEPAIAGPSFGASRTPNNAPIGSTAHIDFIVIAYHREVVEILHPWVFDFDHQCTWASQLYQLYEANLLYRNHILFSRDFHVENAKHRNYPRECNADGGFGPNIGFPAVHASVKRNIKPDRAHCLPASPIVWEGFNRYSPAGSVRPRLSSYLPQNSSFVDDCTNVAFLSNTCCTVDVFSAPQTVGVNHGRVVKDVSEVGDIFSLVWGLSRWEFEGMETLSALGVKDSDVLLVESPILKLLPLLDTRSIHSSISSLPAGTWVNVSGFLPLVIASSGRAHLRHELDVLSFFHAQPVDVIEIPLWRVRYLALSAKARKHVFAPISLADSPLV